MREYVWVVTMPGNARVVGIYERERDAVIRASEEQAATGRWCRVALMRVWPPDVDNNGVLSPPSADSGLRVPESALPPAARRRAESRRAAGTPPPPPPPDVAGVAMAAGAGAAKGGGMARAVDRFMQLCGPAARGRLARMHEIGGDLAGIEARLVSRRITPEEYTFSRDALRSEHASLRAGMCALAGVLLSSDAELRTVSTVEVVDAAVAEAARP